MTGPSVDPTTIPRYPLNIRLRNYRGRTIVGGYQHVMELSETAAFVWRRIDGARTVVDIALLMAQEYDIDAEVATADIAELLSVLAVNDLVLVEPSAGEP